MSKRQDEAVPRGTEEEMALSKTRKVKRKLDFKEQQQFLHLAPIPFQRNKQE